MQTVLVVDLCTSYKNKRSDRTSMLPEGEDVNISALGHHHLLLPEVWKRPSRQTHFSTPFNHVPHISVVQVLGFAVLFDHR